MISKADYLILKELKKQRRPRDDFTDDVRVGALIDNGYIEIYYGDKLCDAVIYTFEKTTMRFPAIFQQILALTVKGRDALEEYEKSRNGKILRLLFEIALAFFAAMLGYFLPKIIG